MSPSYSSRHAREFYFRCPTPLKNLLASAYSLRRRQSCYGEAFRKQLEELERNSSRSYDQAIHDQAEKLSQILAFAQRNVPYYRDLFRLAQFDAGEPLKSIDDLRRIPVLDKETIRQRTEQFSAIHDVGPTVKTHTSGTTGMGLHLLISQEAIQRSYACQWFHYAWAGIRRGVRVATLAGHPVSRANSLTPPFWVRDFVGNEMLFSSQHISPSTLPAYADALAHFNPSLIRGYPSSVSLLADYLLEAGKDHIRPIAVYTSSETLLDFQKEAIEKAFGCRAYSYYGNTERAAHILQCIEGNFHIVTDACLVEVLSHDGKPVAPGQEGEMVCTGLLDRAMPFIRYRVGDTAVPAVGPCPCGRSGPILSRITGRVEDIVITPDGRHVGRLDHAFKDSLRVKEAQIIQEDINSIRVLINPRMGFGRKDEKTIIEELRLRLGDAIGIEIELTDTIPRTDTAKLRFVISKVPTQVGHQPVQSSKQSGTGTDGERGA